MASEFLFLVAIVQVGLEHKMFVYEVQVYQGISRTMPTDETWDFLFWPAQCRIASHGRWNILDTGHLCLDVDPLLSQALLDSKALPTNEKKGRGIDGKFGGLYDICPPRFGGRFPCPCLLVRKCCILPFSH